jgi:hypothetical protein
MDIVIFIIMLMMVDLIALRWGVNSSDTIDSPEWERRERWYGFH